MVKTNLVFSGYVRCKKCKKHNMTFQHGACDCKRRNLGEYGVIGNGRFMPYSEVKTRVLSGQIYRRYVCRATDYSVYVWH